MKDIYFGNGASAYWTAYKLVKQGAPLGPVNIRSNVSFGKAPFGAPTVRDVFVPPARQPLEQRYALNIIG